MFRVVPPPIIRSAYNCIYSIWYLSHRYCYLLLSWKSWNRFECAVGGVRHPQHPPRSPDATPCDFFLWGYVKDQVYVPPLPASIPELKVRIRTSIETITADMLQTVWNELDYRVYVRRITKGAHIEHL